MSLTAPPNFCGKMTNARNVETKLARNEWILSQAKLGHTNQTIASALGISDAAVKVIVRAMGFNWSQIPPATRYANHNHPRSNYNRAHPLPPPPDCICGDLRSIELKLRRRSWALEKNNEGYPQRVIADALGIRYDALMSIVHVARQYERRRAKNAIASD